MQISTKNLVDNVKVVFIIKVRRLSKKKRRQQYDYEATNAYLAIRIEDSHVIQSALAYPTTLPSKIYSLLAVPSIAVFAIHTHKLVGLMYDITVTCCHKHAWESGRTN